MMFMSCFAHSDAVIAGMEAKSQTRHDEGHFKFEFQFPEVHAIDATETIKSLDKFEKILSDSGIKTYFVWVCFLRVKLKGIAKTWMEAALFGEPGMILMCTAKQTEGCCLGSFQESTSFHQEIGVVKFEELREKTKPQWKAVVMTSKTIR